MNPGDAALYGLAAFETPRWNELAAQWLREGYESQILREFAELSDAECAVLADELMPEVLRSLGLPVSGGAKEFRAQVFDLSGFANRCRVALAVVQRDLDRTGFGEFRLHPVVSTPDDFMHETPLHACAALPDDTYASDFNNSMSPDLDDPDMVVYAALSACDTLLLVADVRWPRCIHHTTKYLLPYPPREEAGLDRLHDDRPWWWCNQGQTHRVNPIGELTASA